MKIEYIVVQAGGQGSRLQYLTENKPKALVPVDNLPILFHLFQKYPDKKFIIIGDYKKNVLREYLRAFAGVNYILIEADGKGTCGGVLQAIYLLPEQTPFLLIWSDLILSKKFSMEGLPDGNYVGLSVDFPCRWSFINCGFTETPSSENGVAGFFLFTDKSGLHDIPKSGEFVRYLQDKRFPFEAVPLQGTKEYGILEEYLKLPQIRCRPFNRIQIGEKEVEKQALDVQGETLAKREKQWYRFVIQKGFLAIPEIISFDPFKMKRIYGNNIYELAEFPLEEKRTLLKKLVAVIEKLHACGQCEADAFSIQEAYINKTWKRLEKVRDLVPFAGDKHIRINGRLCRNILFFKEDFEKAVWREPVKRFQLIHGDCTFSNMMLSDQEEVILLDPRGYFGFTEIFGDPDYDWAKLYYSLVGNYDYFNLRQFTLNIEKDGVWLMIPCNGWAGLADDFFAALGEKVSERKIKLLHAMIWLSFATYAWQDFDSVCGAFYNGLYYLEEALG